MARDFQPLGSRPGMPRMLGWYVAAALLVAFVADYSPQQLPVMLYKIALVIIATPIALYIDRSLFGKLWPSMSRGAGPDSPVFAYRLQARAIVYATVVIGISLAI